MPLVALLARDSGNEPSRTNYFDTLRQFRKGVLKYAIAPAAKITVLLISDYNSRFQGSRPCPIDFLRKNTWE